VLEFPPRTLTPAQARVRLALRACTMSVLQAGGVWLIAHGSLWAGCTGFLISYHWAGSAQEINVHRVRWARASYGAGGAAGTIIVLLFMRWLLS
jgi:hypothetical protein